MSWDDALQAYGEQLDATQRALNDRLQVVPPPFVPPADLGPLPTRLADRAAELLQQGADLEALLSEAHGALGLAIRDIQPTHPTPRPSMVDVRA